MQKTPSLINMSVGKALLTLALPIMLANTLQSLYQLTDSFWVGRLGENAVAAVAMSGPVVFLLMSLGIGLAVAGSTFVSQYYGAQNQPMVEHSAAQTLLMILTISFTFIIGGFILAPYILTLMGAASNIYHDALLFLRISFIALIFNFSFFMFQSIMRGIGNVKLPVFIVLGTVLLNLILDPLFIFGYKFIPAFGVAGAALATIATQGLAAIIGFYILFEGRHGIHLKRHNFIPDFPFIKRAFKLGLPASLEQVTRSSGMVFMTAFIAGFGTLAVAGYGVGSNVVQVVIIAAVGLASATATLIGQNIGAGRTDRAEQTAMYSARISFVLLTIIGVAVYAIAPYLIAFFVPNEPDVIATGTQFLHTISLFFGFIGLQMSFTGVFRASGNTLTSMSVTMISQWLLQLPVAYIMARFAFFGIVGVWSAIPLANIVAFAIALSIFLKGNWKHTRITEQDKRQEEIVEEVLVDEPIAEV